MGHGPTQLLFENHIGIILCNVLDWIHHPQPMIVTKILMKLPGKYGNHLIFCQTRMLRKVRSHVHYVLCFRCHIQNQLKFELNWLEQPHHILKLLVNFQAIDFWYAIFEGVKSSYFCYLGPHAKFRNPRTTFENYSLCPPKKG